MTNTDGQKSQEGNPPERRRPAPDRGEFHFWSAGVPRKAFTEAVAKDVVRRHFVYSLAGLGVGFACMVLGLVLLVHGVTGATGWVVQLLGLKSTLSDAAPGVVLAVVGFLVVFVTRFDVRAET
jgi:hypothetical protein